MAIEGRKTAADDTAAGGTAASTTGSGRLLDHHAGARLKGIGLVILAVTLFSVLDAAAKLAAREVPVLEVVWFRYVVQFVLAAVILNPRSAPEAWRVNRWGMQIGRSVALTGVTAFNFVALRHLQLAETVTIAFLGPLVIAGLSVVFLGERIGPRRVAAILVGFLGILVVTRPGFTEVHWAVIPSIASMLCYSIYAMMTRSLAGTESAGSMLLVMAGLPSIVLLPVMPLIWVTPSSPTIFALLFFVGVFGGVAHYFVILAHRYASASVLAPFTYAQILSMVAFGYFIFGDVPNVWTLVGAAIVVGSGLYLLHRERAVKGAATSAGPTAAE